MRFDDANLWSGCYKRAKWRHVGPVRFRDVEDVRRAEIPRLVITARLRYWSLPLTFSAGGHVISRAGFTIGVGPIYFSWSWV